MSDQFTADLVPFRDITKIVSLVMSSETRELLNSRDPVNNARGFRRVYRLVRLIRRASDEHDGTDFDCFWWADGPPSRAAIPNVALSFAVGHGTPAYWKYIELLRHAFEQEFSARKFRNVANHWLGL